MYAIYAYIDPSNHPNVGIYGIHGVSGKGTCTRLKFGCHFFVADLLDMADWSPLQLYYNHLIPCGTASSVVPRRSKQPLVPQNLRN